MKTTVGHTSRPDSSAVDDAERDEDSESALVKCGIVTNSKINAANRIQNAASVLIPLIGTVGAVGSMPWLGFTIVTAGVFSVFFLLTVAGIELGLHRYFTHRAFKAGRIVHACLALFGTWAFQSPISRWVADHRRHHRFSDQPYDPHSPYWIDDVPTGGIKGFLWSHVLWIIGGRATDERKYARDILSDPITALLSNRYWWFAASGLLLPAVMGYIAGGVQECARCLLWAGFARVALLQQFTWSVNSIGHCLGEILPGAKDQSRNNLVLAILTLGGGLHSYHHKHPAAAVNRPASWDPLGGLILALEKVGLIWRVRKFSD